MVASRFTKDGLPVITETTFGEVVTTYPIDSPDGDPAVRKRIQDEFLHHLNSCFVYF